VLDSVSRALFHTLAGSWTTKRLASCYGMRAGGFARRFIAGEGIGEAMDSAEQLAKWDIGCTFNHLGESVTSREKARETADTYLSVIEDLVTARPSSQISVKLTRLAVDTAACEENLRRVLDVAGEHYFVRIDMEQSSLGRRHTQPVRTPVAGRLPQRRCRAPVVSLSRH